MQVRNESGSYKGNGGFKRCQIANLFGIERNVTNNNQRLKYMGIDNDK